MPRLDRLSELARKTLLTHNVMIHDDTPWTMPSKPLSQCRVALVTTGGLHLRSDRPFTNGDQTFRVIPSGTPARDILLSHTSIGFDRSGIIRDLNLLLPADRLRELVELGEVGSLGPNFYSFLGAQRKYEGLINESGPEVGRRLKAEGVDAILMTGAWPLCTHTGGVLVREIEKARVATTSISLVREHTAQVKPPRALFVPFPFGYPLGEADNPDLQLRVFRGALALLQRPAGPVLEDFPDDSLPLGEINLPQAASVPSTVQQTDPAFEVTSLRPYYEQWVEKHGGRTAVGLTGVDQRRFRGLVRFMEAFAAGDESADAPERTTEVSLPQFIRWAADDLRSFYFEARLEQKPSSDFQEINRWFWGETAMANLLRSVRDRMKASGDPALDAIAFGIAR